MDSSRKRSARSRLFGAAALVGLLLGASMPVWAQGAGGGGAGGGGGGAGGGGSGSGGGTGLLPGGAGIAPLADVQGHATTAVQPYYAGTLLGDPGGVRSRLLRNGVEVRLDYLTEFAANVTGQRTGSAYAHQIALSVDADFGKLANIPGFKTHGVIINRAGRSLSKDVLGDFLTQSQEVYGAGFNVGAHLVYLYAELELLNGRVDIAAGRLPVGVDFAASPLACIAIALTPQCGVPRALANSTAFTTWPQSGWGGRIRVRPTPETFVQAGVYEVQPFPAGGRTGFQWGTNRATGVSFPIEVAWEPKFGPNRLQGHYKVGYIHDTSDYQDLYSDRFGQPVVLSGLPGQTRRGRDGFWIQGDQMLMRNGPGPDQGLIVLASYAHSSSETSRTSDTAFATIINKGFMPTRPNDMVQLAAGWFGLSDRVGNLQQFAINSGLPVPGGRGTQRSEYVFEANYTAELIPGITVTPAIQYFLYPNADRTLKNALVFAGRVVLKF